MPHRPAPEVVLEHLPAGVVVLDDEGRLLEGNTAAERLLGTLPEDGTTGCCELVGCRRPGTPLESRCISEAVRARGAVVGELLVQTPAGGAWVTAAPLEGGGVVLHLRTDAEARAGRPTSGCGSACSGRCSSRWAAPCSRATGSRTGPARCSSTSSPRAGGPSPPTSCSSAFWPQTDGTPAATNVRQAVHALRDRMEPERERQAPSRYIAGRRGGGYELVGGMVLVDADVFAAAAEAGLAALRDGDGPRAEAALARASALYRGDFLADEPEAEWALPERARLRTLAGRVLRALAGIRVRAGELDAASELLQRLAELEPLDVEAQRQLLTLLLRRGRRTEAARRYEVVARRFRRAFGEEPGFELAELARSRGSTRR